MQKASVAFETVAEPERPGPRIALSEIENVLVGKGVAIWQQLRGTRPYPTRAEMSPRVMSGLLRNAVLVRVLCEGDEYEFRIVGDAIVQAQGASLQGMTMAEIDLVLPGYGSQLRSVYKSAYRKRIAEAYRAGSCARLTTVRCSTRVSCCRWVKRASRPITF
jgi:hypothetical protein